MNRLSIKSAVFLCADSTDIVDEAITFFRANVFFRNFDIQSSADKLLIYLTFYINVALKRLEGCRTLAEGTKAIIKLGLEKVPVPGEPGFQFPGLFSLPQSQQEGGKGSFLEERKNKRILHCFHSRCCIVSAQSFGFQKTSA